MSHQPIASSSPNQHGKLTSTTTATLHTARPPTSTASVTAAARAEAKRTRFASKESVQYSAVDGIGTGGYTHDHPRLLDGLQDWLPDGYDDDVLVAPDPTARTGPKSNIGQNDRPKFSTPLAEAGALLAAAAEGRPLPKGVRQIAPRPCAGAGEGGAPVIWPVGDDPLDGDRVLLRGAGASSASDGFNWRQMSRAAEAYRGNLVDATLYVSGSGFRRECFQMDDLLLIVYSGDAAFAERSTGSQRRRGQPQQHPIKESQGQQGASARTVATTDVSQLESHFRPTATQAKPPQALRGVQPVGGKGQLEEPRNLLSALRLSPPPATLHAVDVDLSLLAASRPTSSLTAASAAIIRQASPSPLPLTAPTVRAMEELLSLSEELAGGKVVKNLTVFPSLQVTLVHPDMTREFESCCKMLDAQQSAAAVAASAASAASASGQQQGLPNASLLDPDSDGCGIKLFYDTTFAFGRIYATLLTFVNGCSEGEPVMPLAVNLHERKFKSSHQLFWARIVGDLPALQKYRFPLIIDDAEPAVHLAVRTQAPNLVQLEAWTHRFRDVDTHLRARGYGDEAIRYFKACVSYLLRSDSKQAMHDKFRKVCKAPIIATQPGHSFTIGIASHSGIRERMAA